MRINKLAVAERLTQVMQRQGLTQQEFASLLGVSQPAVSQYLQGRLPPADVLLEAATIGNTTVEWILVGGEETMRVREPALPYGSEITLLEFWKQLPENLKRDLLALMRHLLELRQREKDEGSRLKD